MRRTLVTVALLALGGGLTGCDQLIPKRSLGEQVWRKNCAECHGLNAEGKVPKYRRYEFANLLDDSWENGGDDNSIENSIVEGIFPLMPEFPDLTYEERRAVIAYLRELRSGN